MQTPEQQANPETKLRRTRWSMALRLLLAVGLTAGLVWYLEPGKILDRMRNIEVSSVLLASAILAVQYAFAASRWHYVLRRHRVDLPATQSLAIFGAGALGNIVALTAIAGISVRGALLFRRGVNASRVFGVLLVERSAASVGFGLCILIGIAATPLLGANVAWPHISVLAFFLALLLAVIAGAAAWVLRQRETVRRFVAEIRASFLSASVIAVLTVLSCIVIWLGFAAVAVLAHGMGLEVNPAFFFAVMPVVALLSALPVSIGGWGVREGAMVAGLMLFGVPADAGVALSITYGALGTAIVALAGGASALLLRRPADQ